VALSGNRLIAVGRARRGEGYVFERVGGVWEARDRIPVPFSHLDLDASGDYAVLASPFDDQRQESAGAVSVYSLDGSACASLSTPRELSWGKQRLGLERGPDHAGHVYWVLGSLRGTLRGAPYGGTRIPLNPDAYFWNLALHPNAGLFSNNLGRLDADGRASLVLAVPPEAYAQYSGLAIDHAFVEFCPTGLEHVSNPVTFHFGQRR
jgi:hypothetical protein